MLGYKAGLLDTSSAQSEEVNASSLPASVDWRSAGAVTPVKNQASCGSCWSFSATGAMEGAHFLSKGSLISISEQQLVDCSTEMGNAGCNGGWMYGAFGYAIDNEMELEEDYAYTARDGVCKAGQAKGATQLTARGIVKPNSPSSLQAAVARQPIAVGIQANRPVFNSYTGGIITSDKCGTSIDHGVLVVGYGTDAGTDYWLLKNSWGVTWGEKGYFRILRESVDGPGICGLQQEPTYPTV